MKIAVATVFYPGMEDFYPDFSRSLLQQTDRDIKLFIINDGCNLKAFDLSGFDYLTFSPGGSIAKNRELLIKKIFEDGLEWIVFADADDYFEKNRIEVIRSLTGDFDLIANEIIPFTKEGYSSPRFGKALGDFKKIELDFILDKNLFGLSNVACRTSYLIDISVPSEIIAVDWFLFTKAMQAGARACFTSKTRSYYRQWSENIIGIDKTTEKEIETGIKAKYFHYKNLKESNPFYKKELDWLSDLYNHLAGFDFENYIQQLKVSVPDTTFWWENIKNYKNE